MNNHTNCDSTDLTVKAIEFLFHQDAIKLAELQSNVVD